MASDGRTRNPAKDQVAIVGVGTTAYRRDNGGRSAAGLALEACRRAIGDAGVDRQDIDGLVGSTVPTKYVQSSLGIPRVTWWADVIPPFSVHVVQAMQAVFAGLAETVLVYHANYRGPNASKTAGQDPFRRRNANLDSHAGEARPEEPSGPYGYAGWARRYLHEFGADRRSFGRIVLNSRTNAGSNPHALYRDPLTMEQYLDARMVRDPLNMLDMDVPVDGADALVVTTVERARDLPHVPILIHAATLGRTRHPYSDQLADYIQSGKEIVAETLWSKSDVGLDGIDIFFPYDGFSNIALAWFEAVGYCKVGEAPEFLEAQWDAGEQRLKLDGRVLVNTHGGSLSEGGTQGAGHVREAVDQLRGSAGDRAAPDVRTALVVPGGFLWNAAGLVLRRP